MSPPTRPLAWSLTTVVLAGLGLAACGGGAGAHTARPAASVGTSTTMNMPDAAQPAGGPSVAADTVAIQNFKFDPPAVMVKVGTTVTWTNKDDEAHTVFFAYDGTRSPILVNSSNVYTKSFTTPGTFVYHCTIHPFMTGTVTVTA